MRKKTSIVRNYEPYRCKGGCTYKLGRIRRGLAGEGTKRLHTTKICDKGVHQK